MSWGAAHALPRDRFVEVTSGLLYSPPFLMTRPSDDLCEGFGAPDHHFSHLHFFHGVRNPARPYSGQHSKAVVCA